MGPAELVRSYYSAFNNKDWAGMLALVHDDVVHFPNQGVVRIGKEALSDFILKSADAYDELLTDMEVMTGETQTRLAAEFMVNGSYMKAEPGFPEANGQKYALPGGSFMEMRDGKIVRITTYYNLNDWIDQVSGG